MFFKIALGAIGVAVLLVIAYLVIAQARAVMPAEEEIGDGNLTESLNQTQSTILAGFGLLGVGVIVLAAFAIINIWK